MKTYLLATIVAFSIMLTGCGTPPGTIVQTPLTAKPQVASTLVPPANGAIFQTAAFRPMFEDHRARLIGDTITITINENSSAASLAGTSSSKTGAVASTAPNLFGVLPGLTSHLATNGSTSSQYADKGADTSSNNFISTLGVTVVDVLSNGNLVVSGEKQVALDKGAEFIRFSGVVDPSTITTGNFVSSTQVSDARIEYRTNAKIDKAEIESMLARFFMSVMPL
jgi:flagellar L-ring protein precursor FlgH